NHEQGDGPFPRSSAHRYILRSLGRGESAGKGPSSVVSRPLIVTKKPAGASKEARNRSAADRFPIREILIPPGRIGRYKRAGPEEWGWGTTPGSGLGRRAMGEEVVRPGSAEFAEYLRQAQTRLYGYIHSLVRDLNDADDLFQQTTLILWMKFAEFDRQRSFFAWACGIARLEVANFLRTRGRQRLYFSDHLDLLLIEAQAEMTDEELEDRRDALARCVERLRQHDRDLLTEWYDDESS